jgi:hypothetical protein
MVMKKLMFSAAAAAVVLTSMAAIPSVALAQAGERKVLIFGTDPCPRDAICIRAPESQRYRIPDALNPQGTVQERQSWSQKSKVLTTVGDTGAQSCSAVGPGGHTGCLVQTIKQARTQTRQQAEDNQPPE